MAKEKDNKNQKHFFKDFKAELKKVVWPTPKQLVNNTIAVVVIVAITTLIVFVLDLAFSFLNDNALNKLKSNIKKPETVIEQNIENETSENSVENNTVVDATGEEQLNNEVENTVE